MIARRFLWTILGLAVACVGPYGERPSSSAENPSPRPAADSPPAEPETEEQVADPEGTPVVGHVTPDGRFHPDTASAAAEPAPVERQTVVTGKVRAAPAAEGAAVATPSAAAPPAASAPAASGYRVQVFAARDPSTAAGVARRLEDRLEGQPVYVERADSWHKVRVGDFSDREEAERLRARLAEMGYAEAWTVRTTIRAPR